MATAALVVLIAACANTVTIERRNRAERGAIRQILDYYHRPASEFFFVGRPGQNRLDGRLDLVYDDWLYPVFESLRLAEPRSAWLAHALGSGGSVRYVVTASDSPQIDGLGDSLRNWVILRGTSSGHSTSGSAQSPQARELAGQARSSFRAAPAARSWRGYPERGSSARESSSLSPRGRRVGRRSADSRYRGCPRCRATRSHFPTSCRDQG